MSHTYPKRKSSRNYKEIQNIGKALQNDKLFEVGALWLTVLYHEEKSYLFTTDQGFQTLNNNVPLKVLDGLTYSQNTIHNKQLYDKLYLSSSVLKYFKEKLRIKFNRRATDFLLWVHPDLS